GRPEMKHAGTVLAGVACLVLAVPAGAEVRPDQAAAAKGRVVYERYCASCHGANGMGDGTLASDLRVPPADLTTLAQKNGGTFPFDAVAQSIDGRKSTRGHGAPDMPVWSEIFPKTGGTGAPSVSSAVGRITHHLWSIQR
ncbi:MAG TPA: c-type cytochrome, partial [Vicinamibacteria bacterium]|nr:c-type cytochrome [Vicinamibacteria bacterium]